MEFVSQVFVGLVFVNLFAWSVAFVNFVLFFRKKTKKETDFHPPVSILKIFCGLEERLIENLESFTKIDYSCFELILSVLEKNDPVLPLLKRFIKNHPQCTIKLVVNPSCVGPNRQVCNFHNAFQETSGEIVILSDSDTEATPDYIHKLIRPLLEDRSLGLVSAVPLMVGARGVWGHAKVLAYNLLVPLMDVLFQYVTPVGIGPAMAFRRADFLKTGGFPAIAFKLTTDMELARLFQLAGFKARIVPYLIRMHEKQQGFFGHAKHGLRWMVALRLSSPFVYHFFILTCQSLFAFLLVLLNPSHASFWGILALVIAYRTLMPFFLSRKLFGQKIPFYLFFSVLFFDIIFPFLWVAGYFQQTVVWGKYKFVVENGTLRSEEVEELEEVETEVAVNRG